MSLAEIYKNRLCITVRELGEHLPLGRNALYKLVARDDFPKHRVDGKILIPIAGVEKFFEDISNGPASLGNK